MADKLNAAALGVLVGRKDYRALRDALSEYHAVDVAAFVEDLPEEQMVLVFRTLQKDQAMDVFAELQSDTQHWIIMAISDNEIASLVEELSVDDAVDMLEEMPATLVKRVLQNATHETRVLINQFLLYPEYSVGSIMTAEYVSLRRHMTVGDAIKRIRRTADECETIYNCYVTDESRNLIGVAALKDLLLSDDEMLVEELLSPDVKSAITTAEREEAAITMEKYGLMSLPVVDREGRLVGIVTVDDVVDVFEEEATEDFHKMSAQAHSDKPYLKTGVLMMSRNRIIWLVVLMISGMITGSILSRYDDAFMVLPLLVTFITVLTDTGGNAGSQSSTLVIRGMSLGEIEMRDIGAIVWKEIRVSVVVGIPLGLVNFLIIVLLRYPGEYMVALTVSLAMLCTIVLANTTGSILPMLAKLLKADPALMAAPVIATLVDALSLIIYFNLALWILKI